jgi:MFS family permease
MEKKHSALIRFLPFWLFLLFFKFGAGLHYSILSPLGERFLPLWVVGGLMSLASVIQLVLDVPAGKMLDRFGYKRMLAIGTGIFLLIAVLMIYRLDALFFALSVVLGAFGWLFFGPGRTAYVLSHASKKESGRFMALRDIFGSVGIVLAALAIPFVVNQDSPFIGGVILIILLVSFFAIWFSPKDERKIKLIENPHEKTHHQRRHLFRNLLESIRRLNPASMLLVLLNFVGALFYGVVWFVVPLIIAHSPEQASLLGIGLSMFDFAVIVTGTLLYTLVDKGNKKTMVFFGLFLFALAGLLLGLSDGLLFLVLAFIATMGDEIASLPLWAWLHQLDKKHDQDGLVSGIINLSEDLGWAIGPLTAGILYTSLGPTPTLILGAIPLLFMLILYYLAVKKHTINVSLLNVPRKPHKLRHKN